MLSITDLRTACATYASFRNYTRTYAVFLKTNEGAPTPFLAEHGAELLIWLTSWACRQFAKDCHKAVSLKVDECFLFSQEDVHKTTFPSFIVLTG